MKYVNTIRRIAMLSKALHRSQNADHDEHYEDRIFDAEDRVIAKRYELSRSLRNYVTCPDRTNRELRRQYANRRKQVKLACRLLGVDYYGII